MTIRRFGAVAAVATAVGLLILLATPLASERLRRTLEARLNAALTGYTITIGRAELSLVGLSLTLHDLTVEQQARPDSPVAYLPLWRTSVQWRALLSGAVVADMQLWRPQLFLTFDQAAEEARDEVPVARRGWQDAVESVYPLEINAFDVEGGTVSYFEPGHPPLELSDVAIRANNIRNVHSNADRYPSPVQLRCRVLRTGTLSAEGSADFLARPVPRVRVAFDVARIPLARFTPAAQHAHLDVRRGELAARGRLEYAGEGNSVEIDELTVGGLAADYAYRATPTEVRQVRRAVRTATVPETRPRTAIEIAHARVVIEDAGVIDRTGDPPYRLFLRPATLEVRGFSNRRESPRRRALAHLEGLFMGSGPTVVDATFAPGRQPAEFATSVQIQDVDLTTMNDLLRARGGFDVAAGRLSVYAEVTAREGRVTGYVKPLFADLDVYDARQERGKGPLKQLYEALVGGAAEMLANHTRDEVATVTDLSGPIDDPETSTLDIVLGLLRNAFVKAILPGLERRRVR